MNDRSFSPQSYLLFKKSDKNCKATNVMLVVFTRNVSLEDGPETTLMRFVAIQCKGNSNLISLCFQIFREKKKNTFQYIEAINN